MHEGLALPEIELARLSREEVVDLGQRAVGVDAALGRVRLQPRGGVAHDGGDVHDDPAQLLLAPRREECRALHRAHPGLDADGLQITDDGLAHRVVGREGIEVARVEAVRIAGLGEQLLGVRGVVGGRLHGDRELEDARHDRAREPGEAERLGLVDSLAVDGVAGRQPHATVVPRRFRVPLLGQLEPERAGQQRRLELDARRALELFSHGAGEEVGEIHLASLQRGRARRLLRHRAHDDPLDVGRLPPVAVEGLEHDLHAGRERHDLVWARPHGRLLVAILADLLDVLLGHDPARTGGRGAVEQHEVRPRLLQDEAHLGRPDDLNLLHLLLEQRRRRSFVSLEGEFHVLGRHRRAVVEFRVLAERERVGQVILRLAPRLGETRRLHTGRHRLHHRVVDGVDDHVRRAEPLHVAGVEPLGRERDVHAVPHLAFGGET